MYIFTYINVKMDKKSMHLCLTVYLTMCMHNREEKDKKEERALGREGIERQCNLSVIKKLRVYDTGYG